MNKRVYIMTERKAKFEYFIHHEVLINDPVHVNTFEKLQGLHPDNAHIISLGGYYPEGVYAMEYLKQRGFDIETVW